MKTPEKDLFTSRAFSFLEKDGLKIKRETISYVQESIEIDGVDFELSDLVNTLERLEPPCNIIITSTKMGQMLLNYGIITDVGSSRWMSGAKIGPNFYKFKKMVFDLVYQKG